MSTRRTILITVGSGVMLAVVSTGFLFWNLQGKRAESLRHAEAAIYVDARKPGYAGRTATPYTGDLGGLAGANAKCQLLYSGSHMCTQGEMLRSGATGFSAGWGWVMCETLTVTPGPPGNVSCGGITQDISESGATDGNRRSCGQFTSSLSSYAGPVADQTGNLSLGAACDSSFPIHCCY